jgi:hypothetical protein
MPTSHPPIAYMYATKKGIGLELSSVLASQHRSFRFEMRALLATFLARMRIG